MTKMLNKQLGRALSLILSVAMLVSGLPADLLGGILSVKAAPDAAEYVEMVGTTSGEDSETTHGNDAQDDGTTYTFNASEYMVTDADKTAVASGTTLGTDNFFKALSIGSYEDKGSTHEGTIVKRGSDTKTKSLEIDKWKTAGIRFTVKGTASATFQVCSTGKSNLSSVALVDESGAIVKAASSTLTAGTQSGVDAGEQTDGSFLVFGNETMASTLVYEGLTAGTYTILSPKNDSANRAMWLVSASVTDVVKTVVVTGDYTFNASEYMVTDADKTAVASGTTLGTDGFFKALSIGSYEDKGSTHEGTIVKRGSDTKTKSLEIDKWKTAGIRFTVKGTASATFQVCSTGKSNLSSVALVDESGAIVKAASSTLTAGTQSGVDAGEQTDGSFLVFGNETMASTLVYEGLTAGTYTILSPKNDSANRAMWLVSASVSDTYEAGGEDARPAWSSVAAPVVESAKQDDLKKSLINVTVKGIVGDKGADSITVGMYKLVEDKYELIEEKIEAGDVSASFSKSFSATESGTYYFKATAKRADEEEAKESAMVSCAFVLPLSTPNFKSATNKGGGKVTMGWDAVKEAVSYNISYKVADGTESDPVSVTAELNENQDPEDWAYSLDLEAGKTYTVYIVAVRGEGDVSEKGSMEVKVVDRVEREWAFAAFGASTSLSEKSFNVFDESGKVVSTKKAANGSEGNPEDGSVTVWSMGGAGKIVPATTDGVAFKYTKLDPIKDNFVLKAKIHVDAWAISNGQDGFGLMVSDRVGANGDASDPFWNNSYMAAVTKIEYRWNKEAGELTTDSEVAANTSMKLGIGTLARTGVPAGWTSSTSPTNFSATSSTLEYSCGKAYGSGTFNIIGNCTNPDALVGDQNDHIVDLNFTLERNNTGYKITYYDANWKELESKMYYDEKYFDENGKYTGCYEDGKITDNGKNGSLMQMDPNNLYVGFFAARNAMVTFSDIELTVTDATKDAPAEERVRSLIDPSYSIASASNANSAEYDLQFFSNVPGYVTITAADGSYVANNERIAEENTKLHFPITLNYGKNTFTWTMTPDADYEIGGQGSNVFLKDYNVRSDEFTVTYNVFGNKYIYVTPEATSKGKGTEEDPVDIATAVKFVSAGQTILLAGGTYNLRSSLSISRGIDGTAENPIRMIADPNASSATNRPVIDFGQSYKAGMKHAGSYWIMQGFDVTRSGDGTDGLQVSGNHNVIDSVNTYRNGNTGIQLSRQNGTDTTQADWPSYNTVKNCTSYLNADGGYEDADGFAAKLTVGPGNVFDGCIAAYNADDGWDLFAKIETGPIGMVTIKNSIAYGNGWVFDENLNKIEAGNGNGFKMGGTSITGYHTLINSIAFGNKAKGIDSNSCPDIQAQNCISFNNNSYNVAFYTGSGVANTDFGATGVISYRTTNLDMKENLAEKGTQDKTKIYNDTNYWWDAETKTSKNNSGATVTDDWFVSLEAPAFGTIVGRTADGTIDLGDFLKLTDKATAGVGAKNLDTEAEKTTIIDAETIEQEKKELLNKGLQLEEIADQVYTGKAIKPVVRVSSGTEYLTTKDYNIKYTDNIKAGTATVTITGKGNYAGTVTTTFKILPKDIEDEDIVFKNEQIAVVANGKEKIKSATPVLLWGKKKLAAKDVSVTVYAEDDMSKALTSVTAAGRYVLEVKGVGNYTGTKYASFVLTDADHLMSKAKVTFTKKVDATGQEVECPNIVVTLTGKTLELDKDYEVVYQNNVAPGKATGIIRGIGDYAGEKLFYFTIVGVKINKAVVTGIQSVVYSGEAATQEGLTVTLNGKVLKTGTDYTVSYTGNNKAGTARIIFTGCGMYTGKLIRSFKITAYDISDEYAFTAGTNGGEDSFKGHIIVDGLEANYLKGGVKLNNLTVRYYDNESKKTFYLTEKKDYTLSYKNNNVLSPEEKQVAIVTIRGKGAYRGTLVKYFTINPQELDATEVVNRVEKTISMVAPDVFASTKKNGWMSKLVVTDLNGKRLTGTGTKADYVAKYYYDDTNEEVGATDTPAVGTKIRIEITAGPSGLYTGSNSTVYKVIDKTNNINKASVKQNNANPIYYTGEGITLDAVYDEDPEKFPITVTLAGKQLTFGEDYEVVPGTYKNNVKRGTARVTIRGIGSYGGLKNISFKITARTIVKEDITASTDGTDDGGKN